MPTSPEALPVLKRTRLVDEVTEQLREHILTDRLKAGQLLRQVELAEQLGVSRTPLREAFRILERDGLIRAVNGNNTVEVVDYSPAEMLELYQVREVLDGLAARLLAKRGLDDEEAAEFEQLLDRMESARDPYDPVAYSTAHTTFHALIAELCGNARLQASVPMIRISAQMLGRTVTAAMTCCGAGDQNAMTAAEATAVLDTARDQHRTIYEAVLSGDSRAAEAAARRHIRSTMNSSLVSAARSDADNS